MALFGKDKKQKKEKKKEKKQPADKQAKKDNTDNKSGVEERVVLEPHITEKATRVTDENNEYIFKVIPKANKIQIKNEIEDIYDVDIVSVRTINVPQSEKGFGRMKGTTKGYKKAIIKIKENQKIDLI
ncbi:MAG: 50S ribosomal protein L23 [Minisyncoccales bacterium]